MDSRLRTILERCYALIGDGIEPDVDEVCADAPELRDRVAKLLEKERRLLRTARPPVDAPWFATNLPSRIADFTLLEPIGIGGMSSVYRARQEPLGREVALKILREDVKAGPTARLRFAREASITASLEHPNIVPVFAAGEHEGRVYLAMKLLRGRSLDQWQERSPREVAKIGMEVASALAAAHEVGVVHRDVKPANVVVEEGRAYVVDFGLAAFADRASVLTQHDATPGTLLYLAPEVAGRRGSGLDARADVYGLGATLYELLAGRPPFDADNPVRALQQILYEPPEPLGLRGRDHDLEVLVLRALEKAPHRRFQTAEAFGAELQRFLAGESILTRSPGLLERATRLVLRRPVVSALSFLLLLMALALTVQQMVLRHDAQRTLEEASTATASAIRGGRLIEARRRLETLASLPNGATDAALLEGRLAAEHDLQACVLALGNPLAPAFADLLEELVQRVEASHPEATRSQRCRAVLAVARRRAAATDAIQGEFPRTALALSKGPGLAAVSAALSASGSPMGTVDLDHVLVAALLRALGADEVPIENELRLAPVEARSPLLRFALATTLEAQGRYREAYETASQVLDDPVCGRSAHWVVARLAATLGELPVAERLRTAHQTEGDEDRLLVDLALPSELQVLAEGEPASFWQRWRTAPPRCQQLPHYWLLAGYVASREATTAGQQAVARGYFDRGLELAQDRVPRNSLEIARCQLDWTVLVDELESTGPSPSPDLLHRVEALADRAERIAATSLRERASITMSGDALAVAAQCRVELGDWPRAAASFDLAAEIGAEDAMVIHVTLATQFLLTLELDGQVAATMPVPSGFLAAREAYLAVERARRLLRAPSSQMTADTRAQVATSLLLCAACCGDCRGAVPIALEWHRDGVDGSGGEAMFASRVAAAGGVLLDSIVDDDVYLVRLLSALSALREALEQGRLATDRGGAIVATWREHPRVDLLLSSSGGAPLRDRLDQFVASLGR